MSYVIPAILLSVFVLSLIKRADAFGSFTEGITDAIKLTMGLIPYLATVFMLISLMRASGVTKYLAVAVKPLFTLLGIPNELTELIILRPLSGSGSLAVLKSIYSEYGADSYIGVVASIIMGSTDTVLYVTSVYFSVSKDKKSGSAVAIALISSFVGTIVACLIYRLFWS